MGLWSLSVDGGVELEVESEDEGDEKSLREDEEELLSNSGDDIVKGELRPKKVITRGKKGR